MSRQFNFNDPDFQVFTDEINRLSCSIQFDCNPSNFFMGMFGSKGAPSDHFYGEILQHKSVVWCSLVAELNRIASAISFSPFPRFLSNPLYLSLSQVSTVSGSWLTHIDIDGTRMIDLKTEPSFPAIPIASPLPSDCRYRRDLQARPPLSTTHCLPLSLCCSTIVHRCNTMKGRCNYADMLTNPPRPGITTWRRKCRANRESRNGTRPASRCQVEKGGPEDKKEITHTHNIFNEFIYLLFISHLLSFLSEAKLSR